MRTSPSSGAAPGLGGRHVLAAMVAFFAVIILADATMIYTALSTFGGVDNANAYREGLAYNKRIAADARQAALGWESRIELSGAPARLTVSLTDSSGAAVAGRTVVASVGRPATNRFDNVLTLAEIAPGVYEAVIEKAGEGTWIADIRAYADGDKANAVFQVRRRLWVAP